MAGHWRYYTTSPDYEEIQRELFTIPYLRMRETETYYAYMRRMDLLIERAIECRESAYSMWARGRVTRETVDPRDLPSTSTRPVHPTTDPYRASSSRGPHFSPAVGSTTGSPAVPPVFSPRPYRSPYYTPGLYQTPRASHSPRPALGLYARGVPSTGVDSWFEPSPSRREYSTWGYTGISDDSIGISTGSGYRTGGQAEGAVGVEIERAEVVGDAGILPGGSVGAGAGAGSEGMSSEIQAWVPESPVVEVLLISSAEEPVEGEVQVQEEEPEEEEFDQLAETVTTIDSSDDPDYTVGS